MDDRDVSQRPRRPVRRLWSAELAAALERVLRPERRRAILELKEALAGDDSYRSLDVYGAVVDGGVRSLAAFRVLHDEHGSSDLVGWAPGTVSPA